MSPLNSGDSALAPPKARRRRPWLEASPALTQIIADPAGAPSLAGIDRDLAPIGFLPATQDAAMTSATFRDWQERGRHFAAVAGAQR